MAEPALRQVLTFQAGGKALAVDARAVSEVAPAPRTTRVPHAPPALKGLANVRGRALPVVAVEALFGGDGAAVGERIIVLAGETPMALAVDAIGAMRAVDQLSEGHVATADGAAQLLDLERLGAAVFAGLPQRGSAGQAQTSAPVAAAAVAEPEAGFLTFHLAGQVYALPLDQVQAVVKPPEAITRLPKTDAVMIGVAPIGERLTPLVSLHALLGLQTQRAVADQHLVIARIGALEVGLLVDEVEAAIRVAERKISAAPAILNRGAGEARIDSIARTARGLVSILTGERIFAEATVAAALGQQAEQAVETAVSEAIAMEQFVLFRLGAEPYGLPIAAVDEILRLPERVTRVPHAPTFVSGVINHRGDAIPLIEQGQRFGVTSEADARARRVLIVRLEGLKVGFVVDAVEEILSLPASALSATPELAGGEAAVFDRIASFEHDGRLLLLVDPRQLLDQAERAMIEGVVERAKAEPA